jgi:hypothetical protein
VEEAVEVGDEVAVQTADHLDRVAAAHPLQLGLLHLVPLVPGRLLDQQFPLHLVVAGGEALEEGGDGLLLLLQLSVEQFAHGKEQAVDDAASLHLDVVGVAGEVAGRGELAPQLLAPLGEDAEDSGVLDGQVHRLDFLLGVDSHVLGHLPADLELSVLPHLRPVLLPLDLADLRRILHGEGVLEGGLHVPADAVGDEVDHVGQDFLLQGLCVVVLLDAFEELSHVLLEVGEVGAAPAGQEGRGLVEAGEDVVEHAHHQVVVVAALSILEPHAAVAEVVVAERAQVVHFLDCAVEGAVDGLRLGERVLLLEVGEHIGLQVAV